MEESIGSIQICSVGNIKYVLTADSGLIYGPYIYLSRIDSVCIGEAQEEIRYDLIDTDGRLLFSAYDLANFLLKLLDNVESITNKTFSEAEKQQLDDFLIDMKQSNELLDKLY